MEFVATRPSPIVITVDFETDWGGRLPPDRPNCQGIIKGLPRILTLLNKFCIKSTFFISGNLAQSFKSLLDEVLQEGHEIASHGYEHDLNYGALPYKELSYQLAKSKEVLEDSLNREVLGFRTPQFRFNPDLFKALKESRYRYDSSLIIHNKLLSRYNYSQLPGDPFFSKDILEIPVSSLPRLKVPLGLLWINALGMGTYKLLAGTKLPGSANVFYVHPFDIIVKDRNPNFGLKLNFWYSFKSKKALETLANLLALWNKEQRQFFTMKEFYFQYRSGISKFME